MASSFIHHNLSIIRIDTSGKSAQLVCSPSPTVLMLDLLVNTCQCFEGQQCGEQWSGNCHSPDLHLFGPSTIARWRQMNSICPIAVMEDNSELLLILSDNTSHPAVAFIPILRTCSSVRLYSLTNTSSQAKLIKNRFHGLDAGNTIDVAQHRCGHEGDFGLCNRAGCFVKLSSWPASVACTAG